MGTLMLGIYIDFLKITDPRQQRKIALLLLGDLILMQIQNFQKKNSWTVWWPKNLSQKWLWEIKWRRKRNKRGKSKPCSKSSLLSLRRERSQPREWRMVKLSKLSKNGKDKKHWKHEHWIVPIKLSKAVSHHLNTESIFLVDYDLEPSPQRKTIQISPNRS